MLAAFMVTRRQGDQAFWETNALTARQNASDGFWNLLVLAILGALMALPHKILQERLFYFPYVGMGAWVIWSISGRRSVSKLTSIPLAFGSLAYGLSVVIGVVLGPESDTVRVSVFHHAMLPVLYFFFGIGLIWRTHRGLLWYLAGNAIVSVSIGFWTLQQVEKVEFFDAVSGVQTFTGNRAWVHPLTFEVIFATNINVACFAAVIGLFLIPSATSWRSRALIAFSAILYVNVVIGTETRSGLLVLVLGFTLFLCNLITQQGCVKYALAILGPISILVAYFALAQATDRFTIGYNLEEGLLGREELWRERLTVAFSRPFGSGLSYLQNGNPTCHNQYIEVLYDYGYLAGFCYVGFALLATFQAVRVVLGHRIRSMLLGVAVALLALLAHGLIDSQGLTASLTYWHIFMLIGCLAAGLKCPTESMYRSQ